MDKLKQSGEEEADQRDIGEKRLDDSFIHIYCARTKCQALLTALGGRGLRLRTVYSDMSLVGGPWTQSSGVHALVVVVKVRWRDPAEDLC